MLLISKVKHISERIRHKFRLYTTESYVLPPPPRLWEDPKTWDDSNTWRD